MEKLSELLEEGYKYIISGREKEWNDICLRLCNKEGTNEIGLRIISTSLEIIKQLHNKNTDYKDIIKRVDNGEHSGIEWRYVEIIVSSFSSQGADFVKATNKWLKSKESDIFKQQKSNRKNRT